MRFLKLYGGILLILLTVVILFLCFAVLDIDKEVYNNLLVGGAVLIILGVVLCFVGGRSADKMLIK